MAPGLPESSVNSARRPFGERMSFDMSLPPNRPRQPRQVAPRRQTIFSVNRFGQLTVSVTRFGQKSPRSNPRCRGGRVARRASFLSAGSHEHQEALEHRSPVRDPRGLRAA